MRGNLLRRITLPLFVGLIGLCAGHTGEPATAALLPGMRRVPAGIHRPLFRGESDPKTISIAAFQLDAVPVTNGEFLDFVRANPRWQRSQVTRVFADDG
jgi:formylglycine-generating enzyme required for sulfatase activity